MQNRKLGLKSNCPARHCISLSSLEKMLFTGNTIVNIYNESIRYVDDDRLGRTYPVNFDTILLYIQRPSLHKVN